MPRPNYGLDAPGLMKGFFAAGAVAFLLTGAALFFFVSTSVVASIAAAILAVAAGYFLGMGCLMLFWSRRVKLQTRERMLDEIAWRGDERVLDVGCGRGLMLVAAAHRIPRGEAIGIDIWRTEDQSCNSPAGAIENAAIEGVLARIRVETADMRALPFSDASFDVVVSHWSVHNLYQAADRSRALAEMWRVLRPGGAIMIGDIAFHHEYLAALEHLGFMECRLIFNPVLDPILRAISFGSFRPATLVARRSG